MTDPLLQATETIGGYHDHRTRHIAGPHAKGQGLQLDLVDIADQARDYVEHAKAANTRRAYRLDWADFTAWCAAHGRTALPASAETVGLYLTALADRCKPATLQRRLTSISQAHQATGLDSPTKSATVKAVWAGIRRVKGTAQTGKAPAATAELRAMVGTLPETLLGKRDRALLLLGFAGAPRRSELIALDVDDVATTRDGLVVTLRRSKTDREGARAARSAFPTAAALRRALCGPSRDGWRPPALAPARSSDRSFLRLGRRPALLLSFFDHVGLDVT